MLTIPRPQLTFPVLCLLAVPCMAQARQQPDVFEEVVPVLQTGSEVTVRDVTGNEVRGRLVEASPRAISVSRGGVLRSFEAPEVSAIWQHRADSLMNGALWGLAIGAGAGAAFAGIADATEDEQPFDIFGGADAILLGTALGALVGTGTGLLIDAARKESHLVYGNGGGQASFGGRTPGVRGIRVSFRF